MQPKFTFVSHPQIQQFFFSHILHLPLIQVFRVLAHTHTHTHTHIYIYIHRHEDCNDGPSGDGECVCRIGSESICGGFKDPAFKRKQEEEKEREREREGQRERERESKRERKGSTQSNTAQHVFTFVERPWLVPLKH